MSVAFPLDRVLAALRQGRTVLDLAGVDTDLAAYLAVALHHEIQRPLAIVVPHGSDATRVANDLRFFAGEVESERVALLPSIDTAPYADLSPDRGAVMELMAQLARLAWDEAGAFTVLAAGALARKVVPRDVLLDKSYLVAVGQNLDRAACLRALADGGYHAVGAVEDPGTFAVRGGIIDVFPPHMARPVRIDLWGDEVETIRGFHPDTQRATGEGHEAVMLPPVREELLVPPFRDRARLGILAAGDRAGHPTRKMQPLLDDLQNGIPFMGIEGFRPSFYEHLAPIGVYLPKDTVYLVVDPMGVAEQLRERWDQLVAGYDQQVNDKIPALPPEQHELAPAEVTRLLEQGTVLRAHVVQMVDELGAVEPLEPLPGQRRERGGPNSEPPGPADAIKFQVPANGDLSHELEQHRGEREPLAPLATAVRSWTAEGARVVLACRQPTNLDRLERLLKGYGVPVMRGTEPPHTYLRPPRTTDDVAAVLVPGDIGGGFRLLDHGFALVTEEEIFGRKAPRRRRAKTDQTSPFVQSFRELEPGDFIVHVDHGIGRYLGLTKLRLGAIESDFLVVEFAGADKLYLPVYKLGRVQKYVGPEGGAPRVDKLGGTAWQKTRQKARESAEADAYAMLDLYARRETSEGYAFSPPDDYFRSFEATFPFTETPDQERAIDEVLDDMSRARPMDRLLVGDVGFGKTEVAVRAAMKAVLDAKQVAVVVPTTVLALQHMRTFKERFGSYPVRVELLSRTISAKEQKQLLDDLKKGKIDIVVGTHRVLGQDVQFKDLGLLVLDEEHRFGVKDKERLKEVRANVDVLTMTATPIPRTLQLGIGGIRDMSVITTPPADRLSVRTYVCRATDQVVHDAVLRELSRGGQVFFVHNRVESIEARRAWLQALVPEARIIVGHGQMDPKQLEQVMLDFTEGRYNVLVATTIIESGIDIPNANTILIDHADRFGLAQLYQLRGRVGRSRERGFCYLLVSNEAALANDARKRLGVIQKFTELGSGFQVASHDLEIRGAGELLGTKQTGQIAAVGLDLYAQLLDEAVRKLRGEAPKVEFDPEINLPVVALIPEDYVPDTHLRLVFYKRMANASDEDEIVEIADEMSDRFGEHPGAVRNLFEVMRIRTLARYVGLTGVEHGGDKVNFAFHRQSPFPVAAVITLVTAPGSRFRAPAEFRLSYVFTAEERRDTVTATRMCLQRLAEFVTESTAREEAAS